MGKRSSVPYPAVLPGPRRDNVELVCAVCCQRRVGGDKMRPHDSRHLADVEFSSPVYEAWPWDRFPAGSAIGWHRRCGGLVVVRLAEHPLERFTRFFKLGA